MTDYQAEREDLNSYFADPNNLNEMTRLIRQDHTQNRGELGAVLADEEWTRIQRVLDIGCGPGGWCLDTAQAHPHISFVGIDVSQQMLKHATMLTMAEQIENASFLLMDATKPLEFPDQSFDHINIRYGQSFITADLWPSLLTECLRILTPHGTLRVTESEGSFSNSAAFDTLDSFIAQAMYRTKRSFSPIGRSIGITFMLKRLLKEAGFTHIQQQCIPVESSFDAEGAQTYREVMILMSRTILPFIVATGVSTEEEIHTLAQQAFQDMSSEWFCGMSYVVSVHGVKQA